MKNGFTWFVLGSIAELDPVELTSSIMNEARKNESTKAIVSSNAQVPVREEKPKIVTGFGTFYYPPVWIGKRPELTFRQRFFGFAMGMMTTSSTKYKGREVRFTQDGYVLIGEPNKTKCMRLLNEIMAVTAFSGIPVYSVRENDVGEASFVMGSDMVSQMAFPASAERAALAWHQWSMDEQALKQYRQTSVDTFIQIVRKAEEAAAQPAASDYLVYLLEAFTLMQNSEYMESFIMSWLVLERHLAKLWESYLQEESVSGSRKRKLMDPIFWSVDYMIEVLSLSGKVTGEEYKLLMRFKTKRNDITHEGSITTLPECKECFDTAMSSVRKELGLPVRPAFVDSS